MTVSTIDSIAEFVTSGTANNFPFYFKFLDDKDLVVTYISPEGVSSDLVLGIHYTASGAGSDEGGSITTTTFLAGPGQLVVWRDIKASQQTSLRNQGKILAKTHVGVFDKLTMWVQRVFSIFKRALSRPFGRDYFYAENRRISSVQDPVELQDAATKNWSQKYIGDIIEAGRGNINYSSSILYKDQNAFPRVVQDLSRPDLGAGIIAWKRDALIRHPGSVSQLLNTKAINVWEKRFTDLIIKKPNLFDPSTWDWTPAFQAASNSVSQHSPGPARGDYEIEIPGGMRYPLTSVSFGLRVNIRSNGAILCPFDRSATKTHLIFFAGFNIVYGVTIDMGYALNYQTAIWMRGRHSTFYGVLVYRARYAWMFGDITWAASPADASRGDSENVLDHCATVWCITAVRAYGLNTILHFDNCLLYSYKPQMAIEQPNSTDLPFWESQPETTIINCGAIIYIDGGGVCNFSGAAPLLLSQMQPTSASDGKNAYGEYSISMAQLETGYLLSCKETAGFNSQSTSGMVLTVHGCRGYMSTTAGHYIDLGSDCRQALHIDDSCRFYGNHNNDVVYSLGAPVYVSPKAFPGIPVDFFQAIHVRSPITYDRFCATYATSCAQKFTLAASDLVMPFLVESDIWGALAFEWYATETGRFTPRSDMRNVEFDVSLVMVSGVADDVTNFILLVNDSQVDIAGSYGASPRAVLRARRIPAGATVRIQVFNSASRSASGELNNRFIVVGSL